MEDNSSTVEVNAVETEVVETRITTRPGRRNQERSEKFKRLRNERKARWAAFKLWESKPESMQPKAK